MSNEQTYHADLQHYLVVKGNDLIQNSRYSLTLLEQKVILYWITRIRPNDEDFAECEFDMNAFCDLCGITRNRKNRLNIEKTLVSLQTKNFAIVRPGEEAKEKVWYTWFSRIVLVEGSPKARMAFDPTLKPYLLGLKSNFTPYWLENILPMKSGYSIRLYELLRSFLNIGECVYTLDELRARLEAEYDRWDNMKARIIDKVIDEINKYTDIHAEYQTIRESYSVVAVRFIISRQTRRQIGEKHD